MPIHTHTHRERERERGRHTVREGQTRRDREQGTYQVGSRKEPLLCLHTQQRLWHRTTNANKTKQLFKRRNTMSRGIQLTKQNIENNNCYGNKQQRGDNNRNRVHWTAKKRFTNIDKQHKNQAKSYGPRQQTTRVYLEVETRRVQTWVQQEQGRCLVTREQRAQREEAWTWLAVAVV